MTAWIKTAWVLVAALALAGVALAQASKAAAMPMGKSFLAKVSEINLAEVELGHLAEQKGHNDAVRQFGKLMVSDHSQAEEALTPLAARLHVAITAKPGNDIFALESRLSHLSAAEFDKDYMQHMVAGHNGAIAMIEHEIEHDRNASTRAFAEKILPTVQDHLRVAENVVGQMGMSGKAGLSEPSKAIVSAAMPK
jgi:putative membrane protein